MTSRTPPPPEPRSAPPVVQPANEALRRPEPHVIDQRQQQIDPAGRARADVNAPAGQTMKQPGADTPDNEYIPAKEPK